MKVTMTPHVIGALRPIPKGFSKGAGRVENGRTNRNHPNCIIVEISPNTENSVGELWRLALIQTPM